MIGAPGAIRATRRAYGPARCRQLETVSPVPFGHPGPRILPAHQAGHPQGHSAEGASCSTSTDCKLWGNYPMNAKIALAAALAALALAGCAKKEEAVEATQEAAADAAAAAGQAADAATDAAAAATDAAAAATDAAAAATDAAATATEAAK